jgi:chromosome segregation ATPase
MPTVPAVATKADIAELRTELYDVRTELKTEIALVRTELKTEIALVRTELKTEIGEVRADVAVLKADVAELKTDVAELKTDVAELKTDVAQLKTDVAELKTDVAVLKTDVAELKSDFRGLVTLVIEQFAESRRETERHIKAAMEETRAWLRVANDEVRAIADTQHGLGARQDTLRTEFDVHRIDPSAHRGGG